MPEYARLMFENFMKANAQVQEQITASHTRQSENGGGHSDTRDGSGGGSNNGGRDHERDALYKRFNEFRPKCFEETTNPWDANKWVEHMEGIFEVMGCSEHQKAILQHLNSKATLRNSEKRIRSRSMGKKRNHPDFLQEGIHKELYTGSY